MERREPRRRRHRRIPVRVPVRISTIDPERDPWTGRPFFRASRELCVNLSRGGAFVRTSEPLTPGRRVLLEIELPDRRPIEAVGRVAWSRRALGRAPGGGAGVGIEFLATPPGAIDAIESLAEEGPRR